MGHLTQMQEAKLRALWAIGFKFVEICGDKDRQHTHLKTTEEKYVPPAKQPRTVAGSKHKMPISHTADKYPNLVSELLSILPRGEKNPKKLAARAVEALDYWTPDMYHLLIEHIVRHEHPDTLALRFLRACNWDVIDATIMMGKSIYWRTMEYVVEDDIMKNGEGGAAHDEKNAQGGARHLAADFMAQLRMGKAYVFGEDRVGRPVVHVRVRTHHASDQSAEALKRFTIYMFEQARLALKHPIETGTILLDMTGFLPSNADLSPLYVILKCVQENYPESIGLIIIHNAPFGFNAMWRMIKLAIPSSITSKVKFTANSRRLQKYIAPDQLPAELGGSSGWVYRYEEPHPAENLPMQDTLTRDHLLEHRRYLVHCFEKLTQEWCLSAQGSDRSRLVLERRDALVQELTGNYWTLDPYVRARSLYDRQGYFRGGQGPNWTIDKMDQEWMRVVRRIDSVGTASASNVEEEEEEVDSGDARSAYSYDTD